jgi:hypothetical protein
MGRLVLFSTLGFLTANASCATQPKVELISEAIDGEPEHLQWALEVAGRCGVEGVTMIEVRSRPSHLRYVRRYPTSPEDMCFIDWLRTEARGYLYGSAH